MDNGLVPTGAITFEKAKVVLILIVVDNGLVHHYRNMYNRPDWCLNPYCSGQWPRTILSQTVSQTTICLNPYCSGQWPRTFENFKIQSSNSNVLILIVVDNGLVLNFENFKSNSQSNVLILIVVDNGLVP